jgi:hypothetical protein
LGLRRVRLDLLPQSLNERTQIVKLGAVLWSPNGTQELDVGHGKSLVLHQEREQVEFRGSEMNRLSISAKHMEPHIEF